MHNPVPVLVLRCTHFSPPIVVSSSANLKWSGTSSRGVNTVTPPAITQFLSAAHGRFRLRRGL